MTMHEYYLYYAVVVVRGTAETYIYIYIYIYTRYTPMLLTHPGYKVRDVCSPDPVREQ